MQALLQDLRHAGRRLLNSPGFTLAAVATLALGIGATTAIFSVVDAVLLRPLTYPQPDRLVLVWERSRGQAANVVNPGNYFGWRVRAKSFTDLAAFTWSFLTFTGDAPEIVEGRAVTPNFFDILGTAPQLGRAFTPAESRLEGPAVIVLSDGLWRRRFAADSGIIGRAVPVAGGTATVVGVMPRSFRPMPWGNEEYWQPFRLDPSDAFRRGRYAMVIGRLRPAVTRAQAQGEMDVIAAGLAREYPEIDTGWGANVASLTDQVVGSSRRMLWIVFAAVGIVLLIASANLGNLMLVRAEGRRREIAVRTALGASRWRLMREWLAESLCVAFVGGVAGFLLAQWGVTALVALGPASIPRLAEVSLDARVAAVMAAITVTVGIAAGLPAALGVSGSKDGLAGGLHGETGRTTAGVRARRFRAGLVVAQMALALVLLTGAGLLVRSIWKLAAVNPGFDPQHLLTLSVDLPSATYPNDTRWAGFFARLLDRVNELPGVSRAGAISFLPLTAGGVATSFTIVGRPAPEPGQWTSADIRTVDSGYFGAMRIPLAAGRAFTAADRADAPPVVVINQAMARQFWPDRNPVGERLQINLRHSNVQREIIGVVGDVHIESLDDTPRPMIYYPLAQLPSGSMMIVARSSGDPSGLAGTIRAAVQDLDRNLPVSDVATMSTRLVRSMSDRRYPMLLLATFAALAVLLAAVGIYGVLSYTVNERRREFGVRLALGARREDVLRMVIVRGLGLTIGGITIGAVVAFLSVRVLGRLLYEVAPADPFTFAAVVTTLALVALAATSLPALRATRVDPMEVLRTE